MVLGLEKSLVLLQPGLELVQPVQVDQGSVGLVQPLPLQLARVLQMGPLAGKVLQLAGDLLAGEVTLAAELLALGVDRHQAGLVGGHLGLEACVLLDLVARILSCNAG